MKLSFQQRRNRQRHVYTIAVVVVTMLFFGVVFFVRPPLPHAVSQAGQVVALPFWNVRDSLSGAVFGALSTLGSKQALSEENISLHNQISTLREQAFQVTLLKNENTRLRALLGRKPEGHGVAAAVLRGNNASVYDTFIIDAGEEEGVSVNDLVVSEGDVAIGSIEKTFSHSAVVVLFSAPGIKTSVLLGATATPAIAVGQGGGMFATELPKDITVTEGDVVALPSLNSYLFATVETVESDPADSFARVLFRSPANAATLRLVRVITSVVWKPPVDDMSAALHTQATTTTP